MKRQIIIFLVLLALTMLVTSACSEKSPASEGPSEPDVHAISVERLCEAMDMDQTHAAALLDLLAQMDFEGEVLFAYPAIDDNDEAYYHIWIGERTVDVYVKEDDTVAAVQSAGILLYGTVPVPSEPPGEEGDPPGEDDPPKENDPTEPPVTLTLTLESHTASVEAGCDGRVSVFGQAGVEYKIKVYYASGVSTAKALAPKVAAEDGSLVWEWTVSSRAKPGTYKIIVVRADDERDMITLPLEVTAPSED
jgi:hypothetical protein